MTKIFATGVTGYIGGDALHLIAETHPEYEITCLIRDKDKGAQVAQDYPKFKLVFGDLDSVGLIEKQAKEVDIVCNFADADHEPAARAIVKGLAAHEPSRPGFLIHTSGTGILLITDYLSGTYGETSSKIFDDLEHLEEVTSMPDLAPHRANDKIVLEAGATRSDRMKTAIVCPPTIYGTGRGPGNKRSLQVPELARSILERGHGIQVNAGKAFWGNVHVHDLSELYLKLVESAAGGSTAEWLDKPAVWGTEGYYFCENGENAWGEVSQWIAREACKQGLIESDEVKSIDKDEADKCTRHGSALWGLNSRSRAKRAREVLKWAPRSPALQDEVKSTVEVEAQRLGLRPGHARIAAGEA